VKGTRDQGTLMERCSKTKEAFSSLKLKFFRSVLGALGAEGIQEGDVKLATTGKYEDTSRVEHEKSREKKHRVIKKET